MPVLKVNRTATKLDTFKGTISIKIAVTYPKILSITSHYHRHVPVLSYKYARQLPSNCHLISPT